MSNETSMDVDVKDEEKTTPLPMLQSIPPAAQPLSYDEHRGTDTPIVIDNGATTLRFGWADADAPRTGPNTVSKYKERKTNKPMLVFGEAVEVESAAKTQIRTPWEGDLLLNFDALENVLDYTFVQLGIDAENIPHPILMTERLASPLHSRALTSELMFELYRVPSLTYCIDGLMSFYQNNLPSPGTSHKSDGIVISFNTASTSVLPVLNGSALLPQSKRIPFGAQHASDYLLKLVQMKYPSFPHRLVPVQSQWLLKTFCAFSPDYPSLLRTLNDPLALSAHERIVQFPFTLPVQDERTAEELERAVEKRREQGRKLQELAAKARLEKLVQREAELSSLLALKERRGQHNKREWAAALESEGFDDEAEFESTIKKLEVFVKKGRKKDLAASGADGGADEPEEEPSFPLVDVPDEELDEEQVKEKRKQKLMKAGYEARMRTKEQKAREAEERAAEVKREEDERERDLSGWSARLKREHEALMTKLKDRMRRKNDLGDRKSAATQARMKSIAHLAADDKGRKGKRKTGGEDMFGADDADWAIYRKINLQAASDDEEDDLQNLQEIEAKLLAHDPQFTVEHTYVSISSQKSALLTAFKPEYDESDVAGRARLHLNTERWRVCEAWFSPNMAGVDSAGIGEVLQSVLSRFSDQEKSRLVNNVFFTGGPSQLPGLSERLHSTLRPILSPETSLRITHAADPLLDAWKGIAHFARTPELARVSVTEAEYHEWGGERIKRWWGGNWNLSVPPPAAP